MLHCQHLYFEYFGPGDWQPGIFLPGEGRSFFFLSPTQVVSTVLWFLGSGCQPGPLLIVTVVLTSVNKELIPCAVGLRTAVRWCYVDYNWCGPGSRSLLIVNLLGHVVSSAICIMVDVLTPCSPQLKSSP